MTTLRLILGDQLSHSISSLEDLNREDDVILMCEVWQETRYVRHHKKKIAFLFSAMRHFAKELRTQGCQVDYIKLDDSPKAPQSFTEALQHTLEKYEIQRIVVTHPGEYRVLKEIKKWQKKFSITVDLIPDTRFLCTPDAFAKWSEGRKQLRMEYFYRDMRRHYEILMDGKDPIGGQWNFDADNRNPPKKG